MTHELYANNFEELYKIHDHQFNIAFMNVNQLVPEGLENYLASNFDKIPGMYKEIISKSNFEESISQLDKIYYVLDECEDKINLIGFTLNEVIPSTAKFIIFLSGYFDSPANLASRS